MVRCFVALGSNLQDPTTQLKRALTDFHRDPALNVIRVSSFYANAAAETEELQPDYVNAVIALDTDLSAHQLLERLLHQETLQGRVRPAPFHAARTLDCDLLLYGQTTIHTAELQVPHPRLHQRAFVLYPLLEIEPDVTLPDGTPLSKYQKDLDASELKRLE